MQNISVSQAWELALDELRKYHPNTELVLPPDGTLEKAYGWIFFYNSKRFLETGNFLFSLVGAGPAIVNKFTKEVYICGSAYSYEYYVDEYEKKISFK